MLNDIRGKIEPLVERLAKPFVKMGLSSNNITFLAMLLGILAGSLFSLQKPVWAGLVILTGGFFDMVDGAVARISDNVTEFGGVLDSVADRITDSVIFLGIIVGGYGSLMGSPYWLVPSLALVGSLLVSYVRARAESAGTGKLDVGVAERAERLIVLSIGAFSGFISHALAILVVLTVITILQRVRAARELLG